jgi:hypothetical protein
MVTHEQRAKEGVERHYKCAARMQTAFTGAETEYLTVCLFELDNAERSEIYAWCQPQPKAPWIDGVVIVPATFEIDSEIAAFNSIRDRS